MNETREKALWFFNDFLDCGSHSSLLMAKQLGYNYLSEKETDNLIFLEEKEKYKNTERRDNSNV
jgi:hypothetical protein